MITQFSGHQGHRFAGYGTNEGDYSEDSLGGGHLRYYEAGFPYSVVPNYSREEWEKRCGPVIIIHPAKKGAENV